MLQRLWALQAAEEMPILSNLGLAAVKLKVSANMDQPLRENWEQGEEGRWGGKRVIAGTGLVRAVCWPHLHWHSSQGAAGRSWSGRTPPGTRAASLWDRQTPAPSHSSWAGEDRWHHPACPASSGKATPCFPSLGSTAFSSQACAEEAQFCPEQAPSAGTGGQSL